MGLFSHNKENVAPVSPMASVLGNTYSTLTGAGQTYLSIKIVLLLTVPREA